MIWITLQRARTAREAISVMDKLCQTHGYASDGESFSLVDGNEAWLMELIGKGQERGAVWVAIKVRYIHMQTQHSQRGKPILCNLGFKSP